MINKRIYQRIKAYFGGFSRKGSHPNSSDFERLRQRVQETHSDSAPTKTKSLQTGALLRSVAQPFRKHPIGWLAMLVLLTCIGIIIWKPDWGDSLLPKGVKTQTLKLSLPELIINQKSTVSRMRIIQDGELLGPLLHELSIPKNLHSQIINFRSKHFPKGFDRSIRAGRSISAKFSSDGEWKSLNIDLSRKEHIHIDKEALKDKNKAAKWNKAENWVERVGGGVITHSIFHTLDNSDIPGKVALQIADIFATHIDFSKEIHKGDEIWVYFKQLIVAGVPQSEVYVEAVKLMNRKKKYYAFRFEANQQDALPSHIPAYRIEENKKEKTDTKLAKKVYGNKVNLLAKTFFNEEGKSLVKGFLRNPLEFSRISSQFSLRRFHPVLHKFRVHSGVDFAAKAGTPVRATGDAVVQFVGRKGGFGNIIILTHPDQVETRYAHLKGFVKGLRKGKEINQGEVIGYVGKSGLATGYHLHYEFRVAGRPHDPLTVPLPHGAPISKKLLPVYNEQKKRYHRYLRLAEKIE